MPAFHASLLAAAILTASPGTASPADPPAITTASLIAELADLDRLTRFPGPGVRVVQFSSYDRRSTLPGGPDWFANSDGFGGEPIPGFEAVLKQPTAPGEVGEYLICDLKQPGVIVRTWTAAITGSIRVYLDGATTPIFDGPAADFLMHRASRIGGVDAQSPELVACFEQRYADYYPIPFAKSCRIEWVGNLKELHFYHVQARLYPAGTAIETFRPEDVKRCREAAEALAPRMRPMEVHGADAGWSRHRETIGPGESKQLLTLEGPAAITLLEARVEASDIPAALRGSVLRLSFDGHPAAQVVAPLGDFFGAAPGVVPYDTLPMSVSPNGSMRCRFVMPFAKGAVASVENRSRQPVTVTLGAARTPYRWDDRSMHLHARWRADHDLTARGGNDAADLPYLVAHADGGLYVGSAAYIMNPCPVPTAGGNWWGEGDEKVFVDGEARPSIFGTGTEDYFNYAWSESDLFEYPYFAQPICTGPDTRGYITNNRWHVLDAIPFERSIDFSIELFAHTPTPHLSYARIAYWYGRPGGHDDSGPLNGADLVVPPLLPWTVAAAGGARGAMLLEAEAITDAESKQRVLEEVQFSGGKAVRLDGPTATAHLKAPAAGKYRVVLTCLSEPRGATFAARLGEVPLAREGQQQFTLQTPHIGRLVNVWCDPIELAEGDHLLTLEGITGESGVVLDFVWLKPVK